MKYLTLALLSLIGYCAFTQPTPLSQIQSTQAESVPTPQQPPTQEPPTEDYQPVAAENVRYAIFFEKEDEYQAFKKDYQEEKIDSVYPCTINPKYPPPDMKNARYCAFIPFSQVEKIQQDMKNGGFTFQIKPLKRLGEGISKDHPG